MSTFIGANNAGTTLGSSMNTTTTTMVVAAGTGALFPSPVTGQYFSMTLIPASSSTGLPNEIVQVTAVTGDTMTVIRGQEGTTPLSWNVGDLAQNLWTYGQAASLVQPSQLQIQATNYAGTDSGSTNAAVVTLKPVPVSLSSLIGAPIRVLKQGSANTGAYTLNVNGFGPISVVTPGGAQLPGGALQGNGIFTVIYDGASFELQSAPGVSYPDGPAGGDLTGTYPDPTIVANSVDNGKLATMVAGTVKSNLTGSTGNPSDNTLTALAAAMGFGTGLLSTNGYAQIPLLISGTLELVTIQWFSEAVTASGNACRVDVTFPEPFPTNCFQAWALDANTYTGGTSPDVISLCSVVEGLLTTTGAAINMAVGQGQTQSGTHNLRVFAIGN